MRTAEDIEQQALETLSKHKMTAPGQKILVGVSGGADSVVLLHLLHKWQEALGIQLAVGHVHHGIRGQEADDEAEFVHQLCQNLGIPLFSSRENAPAEKKRLHLSTQEAARLVRHRFLRSTAAQIGAERIALAHTETDRIETILLRILRGTGTTGLEGFPAVDLPIIRPLYQIRREETHAYCRQYNLPICPDSSNQSFAYRRNRIRLELLPYLRENFNDEIDSALLRLAEIAKEEADYLNEATQQAMNAVLIHTSPSRWVLSAEVLRSQHRALQRRIVRQVLQGLRGQINNISFEMGEQLLEWAHQRKSGSLTIPYTESLQGTLNYNAHTDQIAVEIHIAETTANPYLVTLQVPGITSLPDGRQIEATMPNQKGTTHLPQSVEIKSTLPNHMALSFATALALPLDAITLPLVVREWRVGDKMSPRGLGGSKKLQDLFTDAKIRGKERSRYPVLVDGGGEGKIWAVFGLRLAEGAFPLEDKKTVLELRNRVEIRLEPQTPF